MRRFLYLAIAASLIAAELPVRQVVLYKNGVGYFERAGEIGAGEPARLSFKQSEMNDILKSLTVRDASGAIVSGLRYESAEPVEEKLATFPFSTADGKNSLSAFLNQLQGSRITVGLGGEKISGAIVLARLVSGNEKHSEHEQVLLLLDSGEMRTIDLAAVTGLQFSDTSLQERLRDYLRVLAGSRSADKRTVTIDSTGDVKRALSASYMVPAPVWKSSYRLIFTDAAEPTLEGWAIVDNTSGEDWSGIRLALVSGRPVSFISNLFETKTIEREVAELPELAAAKPVLYAAGVAGGAPGGTTGGVIGGIIGPAPAAAPPPPPPAAQEAARKFGMPRTSSISQDATATREFADLFEYSFSHPVTIRSGESAMLPFLQQKIGARKLLIYSDPSSPHPMSAVELTNSTGKTLDGGPITVFESASYAGEALVTTLKKGDKRLISYAVDLGTRVGTKFESGNQDIREIHLRRGLLTVRWVRRHTQTYSIKNVDPRAKTLIIEHPIRSDYKLLGVKPSEITPDSYRFEVKLGPGAEEQFPVAEEHEFDSSVAVSNITPGVLLTYIQNRSLTDAGRKVLNQVAALKRRIDDTQQQSSQTGREIQNLSRDQDRTRQNITTLSHVSGQQENVQQYARQLAAHEVRIAALRDRQAELTAQRTALEAELNQLLESTEF